MRISNPTPSAIARFISGWAAANRRDFPWRGSSSRYELAVAEILLQQTAAGAASGVWSRLMAENRSAKQLAQAAPDDILAIVQILGLGSQRTRRLIDAARAIDQGATVIPGIGRYGAAVLDLALGNRVLAAPVDTNTARIVGRLWGLSFERGEPRKKPEVASLVQAIIGEGNSPDERLSLLYGLVDLGAIVCKPARPNCGSCPLVEMCAWARNASFESRDAATASASASAKGGGTASDTKRI